MYPKARLDTLSDGIFGVSMTLLVLDVRLPDDFAPRDTNELLKGLLGLAPKFLPYVLSFFVLGLRWLSNVHLRSRGEVMGHGYGDWWLFYLLLITCVPFTTIVLGRYASLAPAIWLYAGNTMLISAVSFRLLALTPEIERKDHLRERQIALALLMVSSLLAIVWSFFDPGHAVWALALNAGAPFLRPKQSTRPINEHRAPSACRVPALRSGLSHEHHHNDPDRFRTARLWPPVLDVRRARRPYRAAGHPVSLVVHSVHVGARLESHW